MPIHKISLWDLSEVIRKEKAVITARESYSTVYTKAINPDTENPTTTEVAKGPSIGANGAPPSKE